MRKNVGGYERIARLVIGGVLAYLALSRWRGRTLGRLAMMLGMNLLSTGASQKCPANAALGRDAFRAGEREGAGEMGDLPA